MTPAYRDRLTLQQLQQRGNALRALMAECVICPHRCRARRSLGRYGVCRTPDVVRISSAGPHFGEEAPLVGTCGSGTIFFSSCNLKCVFCQNYEISQMREGWPVSARELADRMLLLQSLGCHNINLVTPTHVVPQIVEALVAAVERGLSIPLVYNCGGYESTETLKLLDGVVDIYMPDIKYSIDENARRYSGATGYWGTVCSAVREMQRQVGDLKLDSRGIACRGLLVRHLVLPGNLAGTRQVLEFLAHEISSDCYVNVMDQYHPCYRAGAYAELNRRPSAEEYRRAVADALRLGLHRGVDAANAYVSR